MHKIGILSIFLTVFGCVCTHNRPDLGVQYGQTETDGQKAVETIVSQDRVKDPQEKPQGEPDEGRLPHLRK